MIQNSMISHNQKINLSLRKLENTSIVGKMVTSKEIVGIGTKNKLKEKMKRMIVRKILQLL